MRRLVPAAATGRVLITAASVLITAAVVLRAATVVLRAATAAAVFLLAVLMMRR